MKLHKHMKRKFTHQYSIKLCNSTNGNVLRTNQLIYRDGNSKQILGNIKIPLLI